MNVATLAVAGARKTQSIVEACRDGDPGRRRIVLTYTLSGQRDLEGRLRAETGAAMPDVMGWYSFLLRHWVRPFLPLLYPGRRLTGLNFEGSPFTRNGVVMATGVDRYLDSESRAYRRFLSKLAIDVAKAAEGTVTNRIERIYDEIYVDEVQDMTGYDLDVLELLLRSSSSVRLVGDIRQSVFDTNPQDPRHKKYRGLGMLDWFAEQEKAGLLQVQHASETWRSVQEIADFSDKIFAADFDFPGTVSKQTLSSPHQGVFALAPTDVEAYIDRYRPVSLRYSVATATPAPANAVNFGITKGLTHERVLIFPTGPIRDFLTKGTPLKGRSACGLYVAVTRAVYSVAFVMSAPEKACATVWRP